MPELGGTLTRGLNCGTITDVDHQHNANASMKIERTCGR